MEKINISKLKILELASHIKKIFPDLKIYIKIDPRTKTIILKVKGESLNIEKIEEIKRIVKVSFQDYNLKILVY